MAKQIKGNGTERNGRARRFAMVFFLSLSLYPSLSFSLYLVFLYVKRLEPNNEIACVSFSFPGSGFACFDGIFGLFVGGKGGSTANVWFLIYDNKQTFWETGLNACSFNNVFFLDLNHRAMRKGKRQGVHGRRQWKGIE